MASANHDRRDVTWREDAELGRNARRACNLALLRIRSINLSGPQQDRTVKTVAKGAGLPSCQALRVA